MDGNITGEESERGTGGSDKFALLIKHYRELRNFSLKDLENASGGSVSAGYIHRLESGERNSPSVKKIIALAKALRIPSAVLVATLLHGLEEKDRLFSLAEVLIQNSYFLGSGMLSSEAKQSLIRIVEFIDHAEWSPTSKIKELYQLSEIIDDFKQAVS
ncbi:helix-turn-helix domain-containing protein [Paenibacillus taichungensis]|uniref:helix-turn-helix domain-containing protein n=1 Tax=Paenibacillus taichungensis TaxID=484184 RepID=UPI002872AB3F|nr:helix-turn-helix transcriptional regulator [Paenibacillus taichungensis]MDR9748737.1 helix-turn-helix transcriptional regulator [Paenibacillus taichungensis]